MAHETDIPLDSEDTVPACILVFNASDPCGAGGVTGDSLTIASVGSHPVPIVTGVYIRDTAEIFDHIALDEDAVAEQARAVLEDLSVQVIKVGFCGYPEALSTIAEITADYAAGTVTTVKQHDGSILRLRKIAQDYDPTDRIKVMNYLQERAAEGEVVTGLLYVNPDSQDLHEHMQTMPAPLNTFGARDLCPGSVALEKINASMR